MRRRAEAPSSHELQVHGLLTALLVCEQGLHVRFGARAAGGHVGVAARQRVGQQHAHGGLEHLQLLRQSTHQSVDRIMSNSSGFGGANVSVILEKA